MASRQTLVFAFMGFLGVFRATGQISPVTTEGGITQVTVKLQKAPNAMEPQAEPRRIQVDDRAKVQLHLLNLSPFDVCSMSSRTPTPTTETSVAESLTGTIAGLGAMGIPLNSFTNFTAPTAANDQLFLQPMTKGILATTPKCSVASDPEFQQIDTIRTAFADSAKQFIGDFNPKSCDTTTLRDPTDFKADDADPQSSKPLLTQSTLSCQIDIASKQLAAYAAQDYRAEKAHLFQDNWSQLDTVRAWYAKPIPSVTAAGKLQALVDEMTTYQVDLHKKYDYQVSGPDSPIAPLPALGPIDGAPIVMASPLNLAFSYSDPHTAPSPQTIQVASGGVPAAFNVTAVNPSTARWLAVSAPCLPASCKTGTSGTVNLTITVDPSLLGANAAGVASFVIVGTNGAIGSNIINVTIKPAAPPTECDLNSLRQVDQIVDGAKAVMALIASNNTALQTAQGALKTAFLTVKKVSDDFNVRKADPYIVTMNNGIVAQDFNLGTDRKNTLTGAISCISDLDGKTATTDPINFSVLYQSFPHWSASTGLVLSFQPKRIIGITNSGGTSTTAANPYFAITDSAPAQLVPMAFVNYRITSYHFKYDKSMVYYGSTKEDTLSVTGHVTVGIGVNPNNGANQPEFFVGFALGLNRFLIHPGVDFGRMQSLGGGYTLNNQAPPMLSAAPINWTYRAAFSIGFSVRVAPY